MTATVLARSSGRLLLRQSRYPQHTCSARIIPTSSFARLPTLVGLSRHYADKSFPPHQVITMPALSPTMQSGNIGTWQKNPGDSLAPGDVLVEVETDKAQMDFEVQEEGTLAKILKQTGEKDVPVGNPIAVMVGEGEDIKAFEEFTLEDAGGDQAPKQQEQKDEGESKESQSQSQAQEQPKQEQTDSQPAPQAQESQPTGEHLQPSLDREKAAPSVKRLAKEKGVTIDQIKGTGQGGQVTKKDVENYQPGGGAAAAPSSTPAEAASATYEDIPPSSMRKTIASRLKESWNENPHYFVSSSISVSKLLKLRAALNASANGQYKLSLNDFLVKAVAVASRKVPSANSSWREQGGQIAIRQHNVVDVSVAVSTPVGLMTPIVKNVNALGLETISNTIKELGGRARDGKLKPEEYQGGTITISNMGMNPAVERFTAIINPPQAAILAVGTVKKVAVPAAETEDGAVAGVEWDDQIVVQASFDHRVVDGAVGGEWIRALKATVEDPLSMLL